MANWICSDPDHDQRFGRPGYNTLLGQQETPLEQLGEHWSLAPDGKSLMSAHHVCGACGEARNLGRNAQAPLLVDTIGVLAATLGVSRDQLVADLKGHIKD